MTMQRVIQPERRCASRKIAAGVSLESFYPGGKDGPNGETLFKTQGGQTWSEIIVLGEPSDSFQMALPDIRLPANQLWPMHWHDCWTVVVVLEGQCLIGDWWMDAGDVFIAAPSIEYGPLVIGPDGCRMFEIFAQLHLSPGGYAPEYRDHPTVQTIGAVFSERSEVNMRNAGRQSLPIEGADGLFKARLSHNAQWDLGAADDPARGLLNFSRLSPAERRSAREYQDWSAIVVLDGALEVSGVLLGADDFLLIRPNARLGETTAGADGARVLELFRTAGA